MAGAWGRVDDWLTYIIVAVLYQKGDALAVEIRPPGGVAQTVPGLADVGQQLAVPEAAAAAGVYDDGRVRVMAHDGLEDGQSGESGHQHLEDRDAHASTTKASTTSHTGGSEGSNDRTDRAATGRCASESRQPGAKSPAECKGNGHWGRGGRGSRGGGSYKGGTGERGDTHAPVGLTPRVGSGPTCVVLHAC